MTAHRSIAARFVRMVVCMPFGVVPDGYVMILSNAQGYGYELKMDRARDTFNVSTFRNRDRPVPSRWWVLMHRYPGQDLDQVSMPFGNTGLSDAGMTHALNLSIWPLRATPRPAPERESIMPGPEITRGNVEGLFRVLLDALPDGAVPEGHHLLLECEVGLGWTIFQLRDDGRGMRSTPFGDMRLSNAEQYYAMHFALRALELLAAAETRS